MFKEKCNEFLDAITAMRASAINEAVAVALANEHTPYVTQVTAAKEAIIAEERQKTENQIRALQDALASKIANYTATTNKAIAEHKSEVTEKATVEAKRAYDDFILGVGKLVDNTNLN